MKKLIILRGPSGSGKSTIATNISSVICEADDYFVDRYGSYKFDVALLVQAHRECRSRVELSMRTDRETIVVSNTSTQVWEVLPYLRLAESHGYSVEFVRTPGPWDAAILAGRNVHGVPQAVIERQIARYEPIEGEREWKN